MENPQRYRGVRNCNVISVRCTVCGSHLGELFERVVNHTLDLQNKNTSKTMGEMFLECRLGPDRLCCRAVLLFNVSMLEMGAVAVKGAVQKYDGETGLWERYIHVAPLQTAARAYEQEFPLYSFVHDRIYEAMRIITKPEATSAKALLTPESLCLPFSCKPVYGEVTNNGIFGYDLEPKVYITHVGTPMKDVDGTVHAALYGTLVLRVTETKTFLGPENAGKSKTVSVATSGVCLGRMLHVEEKGKHITIKNSPWAYKLMYELAPNTVAVLLSKKRGKKQVMVIFNSRAEASFYGKTSQMPLKVRVCVHRLRV